MVFFTIETITPKRRARKNFFLVNFGHPIFLLFSNLCCLGPCADVETLKQMLANNCSETHERSVFFDLGPRTKTGFVFPMGNIRNDVTHENGDFTWGSWPADPGKLHLGRRSLAANQALPALDTSHATCCY